LGAYVGLAIRFLNDIGYNAVGIEKNKHFVNIANIEHNSIVLGDAYLPIKRFCKEFINH